jgi:hypothetical protein
MATLRSPRPQSCPVVSDEHSVAVAIARPVPASYQAFVRPRQPMRPGRRWSVALAVLVAMRAGRPWSDPRSGRAHPSPTRPRSASSASHVSDLLDLLVVVAHALLEVGVRRDPDEGDSDLVAIPCRRSPVSVAVEIQASNRPLLGPHESTGARTRGPHSAEPLRTRCGSQRGARAQSCERC